MMSATPNIYCPRCATENGVEQSYCRKCGLGLSTIQCALDGSYEEAQKKVIQADKWISAGNSTLIAFGLVAAFIVGLGVAIGGPGLAAIAIVNVLAGILFGVPLLVLGNVKLRRAKRLLSRADPTDRLALQSSSRKQLVTTQTGKLTPSNQASVTENTTIHLSRPDITQR